MTKSKINSWMIDIERIDKYSPSFENKEYLYNLLKHVYGFIIHCPSPLLATYDSKNNKLFINIGSEENTFSFSITNNEDLEEFAKKIEVVIFPFYPSYFITYPEERRITVDEIAILMEKNKISFDDAYNHTIREDKEEKGVITKIFIKEDKFKIYINEDPHLRMSSIPLSVFLRDLRRIGDDYERKAFIFNNSYEICKIRE